MKNRKEPRVLSKAKFKWFFLKYFSGKPRIQNEVVKVWACKIPLSVRELIEDIESTFLYFERWELSPIWTGQNQKNQEYWLLHFENGEFRVKQFLNSVSYWREVNRLEYYIYQKEQVS